MGMMAGIVAPALINVTLVKEIAITILSVLGILNVELPIVTQV